ncbi:MAG: hypothetical protein EBT92_11205 [Planctomycetes bacterium]|nr:hypothetical protein [Planctomycetota bacterium]
MSTSSSVSFKASPDKVWGAVVKLITSANYTITKTDQGARQIVYQASGGGWAWKQSVQVSVTGIDEDETMVTVMAQAAGQSTLTEGGQQRKLINFIIDSLCEKFQLAENQKSLNNVPGTSGCFGLIMLILLGAAGIVAVLI